uniref:Uncharacterized protein n=1 Tax=Anguilla anguilla TaxID=7936 RepID=A0A0E9XA74_ANGAN
MAFSGANARAALNFKAMFPR